MKILYSYDAEGRTLTESQSANTIVHNLYDSAGRRILSYLTINGTFDAFTHYSYDAQDRVTSIQRGSLADANAGDWIVPTANNKPPSSPPFIQIATHPLRQ